MPLPKVVATDLDGTLLRPDGTLSQRTRDAVAGAEAAGITVMLATGRPLRWLRPVAEALGHRGLAVGANGAAIYDLHTERVVAEHLLAPEVALAIVQGLRRNVDGLSFAVERGGDNAFGREPAYPGKAFLGEDIAVASAEDLVASEPSIKILARHEAYGPDELFVEAHAVVGELAELTYSSKEGLIEIGPLGVSKASTLALLCAERGVDRADVVAFGDMPNDLPMLAWAGTPYAVANAHPRVLAAVERHCPSNADDGVARVLEELLSPDGFPPR